MSARVGESHSGLFRSELIDAADESDATDLFGITWLAHVRSTPLVSPLDERARGFVLHFYSCEPAYRSLGFAADTFGVERKTARRLMRRADSLGWLSIMDEPMRAGRITPRRIYSRRAFWSTDPWSDAYRVPGQTDSPVVELLDAA